MSAGTKLNHCNAGGYCVSANEWLPVEAFDFDWVQLSPIIGCNRLRCGKCGIDVRSMLGFELPPDLQATEEEVYALVDAGDSSRFTKSPKCRIYACRHFSTVARSFFRAQPENDYAPYTPWGCGGHPGLSLPAVLEGVAIDPHTDWGKLARQSFAGTLGVSLHPSVDREPGFWLMRLYRLLAEQPVAPKIAHAAADAVLDPDPRVRLGAIVFFRLGWNAPGAERMAPALRDHPALFADILVDGDPITLERQLLHMLSYRIANHVSDTVAIELMRAALSRKFEPLGLEQSLYSMAEVDQKWLLEHGDQIVAAMPELWDPMQHALTSAGASKGALAELQMRVNALRAPVASG
jgi:hypothetical protein